MKQKTDGMSDDLGETNDIVKALSVIPFEQRNVQKELDRLVKVIHDSINLIVPKPAPTIGSSQAVAGTSKVFEFQEVPSKSDTSETD